MCDWLYRGGQFLPYIAGLFTCTSSVARHVNYLVANSVTLQQHPSFLAGSPTYPNCQFTLHSTDSGHHAECGKRSKQTGTSPRCQHLSRACGFLIVCCSEVILASPVRWASQLEWDTEVSWSELPRWTYCFTWASCSMPKPVFHWKAATGCWETTVMFCMAITSGHLPPIRSLRDAVFDSSWLTLLWRFASNLQEDDD